ncbi:MAG: Spx/MgsR family RNA polymerase-binding regulatory protein [Clostridia bacterium]|nr:Spx/MgsR family RNA polymerase-binding regulatory protein [Clostridia bacterium]
MNITLIGLDTCSTCKRAEKFLKEHKVAYTKRSIVENNPSREELIEWKKISGLSWKRFFNTTGKLYRANHISGRVNTFLEKELLDMLSSDGLWVKRPILITDKGIAVGFNELEWLSLIQE